MTGALCFIMFWLFTMSVSSLWPPPVAAQESAQETAWGRSVAGITRWRRWWPWGWLQGSMSVEQVAPAQERYWLMVPNSEPSEEVTMMPFEGRSICRLWRCLASTLAVGLALMAM
jgi:hypothetical protein